MNNAPQRPFPAGIETVFLDRDGVINEKMPEGRYVTRREEFRLLAGVAEAIALLNGAGIRVIVVSNQRGVALGLYTVEDVRGLHAGLQQELAMKQARIDGFYFCPHEKGECGCRKPLPGLFEQAVADFPSITAASSVMIGDSLSDVEFGKRLGMTTVFLEGKAERQKPGAEAAREQADLVFPSLFAAVTELMAARASR